MLWRIYEDFHSLFASENGRFRAIDGLRSLSCLMIITLHMLLLLNSFIPSYPHPEWLKYVQSLSFSAIPLLSFSIETFFVLSGFLLTKKLLDHKVDFPTFLHQYPMYIFRRACRYWPGVLLISLVMFLLGEPNGNHLSMWLFFQNYIDMDSWSPGMSPLWSVSLDMQIHILLPFLIYLIFSYRQSISMSTSLSLLIVFSLIYTLLTFNPKTMDIMTTTSQHNSMALLISPRISQWIQSNYNFTFSFVPLTPNPMRLYMESLYLPLVARYASFLIGSVLALKLKNIQPRDSTNIDQMKKLIYFGLISFYFVVLASPLPLPDLQQSFADQISVTIFISCSRQLFSMGVAFLLFTALCPSTHPYSSSLMNKFLSLPLWAPMAKLSYLVYVLHFRITLELIMCMKSFDFHRHAIGYSTLIHLAIVVTICLIIACLWYLFVEKPFERSINRILASKFPQD